MIQSTPVTGGRGYRQRPGRPHEGRRERLVRRLVPTLLLAAVAFVAGMVVGALHRPAAQDVADDYAAAYERRDYGQMYDLITETAKGRISERQFRAAHEDADATATATRMRFDDADSPDGDVVPVPVTITTRVFGTFEATLDLPMAEEGGEARIAWEKHMTFPGVDEGEELNRTTTLPQRATLLASGGIELAAGADRASDDPVTSDSIAGELGPIPRERAQELRAEGVPDDAQVGISGLERALDDELRGKPGGRLRAGERVLAASTPRKADPVRSTIVPRVQRAASAALAGRLGGVVAMNVGGADDGDVVAAAGIGMSGLQPPGSTFKIVTISGALEARVTKPSTQYPVATAATLEGVELQNANGESCGGNLIDSFAHSCNSVFAPLGAELGARRLVRTAERFGFNRPPAIDGAATSTIPPAGEIGDDLALGSSAIGQGRVQASTLQMALAAATIADRGRLPQPTLKKSDRPSSARAVSTRTARIVDRAMRAVVSYGTGTGAAISGVTVAGKTGTAELRQTQGEEVEGETVVEGDTTDTTAWFAAYAPARRPRVAVAVMLVEAGAGGAVAAPPAATVLAEALRRRG
ncbi:MAG TPA: penicillin-binding transpeptidase domain-containing protein [Solirubrobacteraceae bacterium]|nr:penicillin-binding transpeptidase domain-containing protein [Solirubrobacteraceae bacterium]